MGFQRLTRHFQRQPAFLVRILLAADFRQPARQIGEAEATRDAVVKASDASSSRDRKIQQLYRLRGLGPEFSTVLVGEIFYRSFRNRREVGAYAGLTGSPYNSGKVERERGLSKAGNPRLRTTMSVLAWFWPDGMSDFTLPDAPRPRRRASDAYRLTDTADGQIIYYLASTDQICGMWRALGRHDLCRSRGSGDSVSLGSIAHW